MLRLRGLREGVSRESLGGGFTSGGVGKAAFESGEIISLLFGLAGNVGAGEDFGGAVQMYGHLSILCFLFPHL